MADAFALAMNSGIVILIFTALENLRIFQSCFFTRKADKINCVFGFDPILNQKLFFFPHPCYNKNEFLIVGEADGNNA